MIASTQLRLPSGHIAWRETSCGQSARLVRGFTLAEIMISVAMVAVLAGLLFPAFNKMLDRSREARCVGNLGQISAAIHLYAADNNMTLPPGTSETGEWFKLNSGSWLRNYGAGGSETAAKKMLRCPLDKTGSPVADYQYYYSYTWNINFLQAYTTGGVPSNGRTTAKLFEATNKILFADAITNFENPDLVRKYPASLTDTNGTDRISKRHHGGANCLFGDGSVRHMLKEDALRPEFITRPRDKNGA